MSPDLHHLSGAYAVDALDDDERTSFEQHLAVCADCRAEVAELSAAAHSLGSLTEATPSPALRASVLSGITRARPLPPLAPDAVAPTGGETADAEPPTEPPPVPPTAAPDTARESDPAHERDEHPQAPGKHADTATVVPLFRRTSTWFAAAAAAVLLAVGGVAWSPWNGGGESISAIEQVSSAPDATTVTGEQGSLTAEVAYSRELGQSAISVNGLPPAPEGKAYQLWYFGADDSITSAGLLATADDGTGEQLLDGDANTATGVGVTLEPAGGSDQPTTDPLVVISLA